MSPRLRVLTTPLVAATLLLSTLGCAKKEATPTPAVTVATGSYKFDGVLKNCVVTCATYPASPPQSVDDQLDIILTTAPQPASGQEHFVVSFVKKPGQPAAAYQLAVMAYFPIAYSSSGVFYANDLTTLQEASGSYSGTFAGKEVRVDGSTVHAVTAGVFANVRP